MDLGKAEKAGIGRGLEAVKLEGAFGAGNAVVTHTVRLVPHRISKHRT